MLAYSVLCTAIGNPNTGTFFQFWNHNFLGQVLIPGTDLS